MALGRYRDAQIMLDKYKEDLSKHFDSDHPAYISYENNQGVLWRLNGHFQDAYDILSSVHNRYTKHLGKEHPSTVSACINLATVLRDLKDYDQSIKYYEEAKEARKAAEGENSPNYALVLGMSAGAYRMNSDTDTAYKYLKEAYVIMANHYKGENCLPCAVILNSMGMLYKQQEKYDRAADAYERCLKIREEHLGPTHPDSIAVRHNLGDLYTMWGKPEEARVYLEDNLKHMEELKERQRKAQESVKEQHKKECNDPTHNH